MPDIPFWFMFILTVMAACQLTESFRHGSIFEGARAWLESRGARGSELVSCGFCLSHWTALIATTLCVWHWIFVKFGWPRIADPCLILLIWLACVRGSNLLNDMTKSWSRTPSRDGNELTGGELALLDAADKKEDEENNNA